MSEKRKSIAVLIGRLNTFFPKEVVRGIAAEAEIQGVNVLFFMGVQTAGFYQEILQLKSTHSYDYQFNMIHDYSLYSGMDGLIINYGTIGLFLKSSDPVKYAAKFGDTPIVFLTDYVDDSRYTSIIADNYGGMYDIVSMLIKKYGCKKILHVSGPNNNLDAIERKRGYLDACRDNGLPVTDDMICEGDFSEFVTGDIEKLMDANPDADAIAFANDEMAFAGYKAARHKGKQVGRDILFTGFDNCAMAESMNPPLATLFQNGISMGMEAAKAIIKKSSGENVESKRIPVQLIERESCGYKPDILHMDDDRDIEQELEEANRTISFLKGENINELRKTWFIPYFARELDEAAGNDREFCLKVVEGLKQSKARASYLFLLDTPVACTEEDEWQLPKDLRLAAYSRKDESFSYELFDRPVINTESTMISYMEDERRHNFLVFLLFSGPIQYGMMACDAAVDDFSFFYMLSLQIGISLGYHEGRKIELAYRNKLLNDMELIRVEKQNLVTVSEYDALTGLLNRRGFFRQAEPLLTGANKNMYLIFADLDHLKQINDNFGHSEGDYAIKNCAAVLKNILREGDLICRLGGDEFVALVVTEKEGFEKAFEIRRNKEIEELNKKSDKPYYIEFSYGICKCNLACAEELGQAIEKADTYLYEAKKKRRDSVIRAE